MIKPTVGRVLWYYPGSTDAIAQIKPEPLAAIVAAVWSDTCVNLTVFDANGLTHNRTSVLLAQPETEKPAANYCTWMPFQVGQAAKPSGVTA